MSKAYYLRNRERLNAENKRCYQENREKILERNRRYAEKNREKIAAYQREYRRKNRQQLSAQDLEYYHKNAERIRQKRRQREAERPELRVVTTYRKRLSQLLKRRQGRPSSYKLLGCSPEEFLDHIERQLPRGCTWENYGHRWHVDHIIPCAAFDLSDPKQLRQCFHFTNLRPLLAKENLQKNARITDPQLKLLI